MIKLCVISLCLLFSVSVNAGSSSDAVTLPNLLAGRHVLIDAYLPSKADYVVGEQVILHVEVATDQWFVKGAKIADFSLPNALVLNHQANNINSVIRKHGRRYASQIVEIPLYPQTEGRFVIPSLAVEFTVKHGNESVSGMLETTPVAFDVRLPSPEFLSTNAWVVGERVTLSETVGRVQADTDSVDTLRVGDVITRGVQLNGEATVSMLMPNLIQSKDYEQAGARIYLAEDKREDRLVRGFSHASLTESVSVVLEEAGEVHFPAISLFWWDTEEQQQRELTLPSHQFVVKHTPLSFFHAYWKETAICAVAILLLLYGGYRMAIYMMYLHKVDRLPLAVQFWFALLSNNLGRCEIVICRKIKQRTGKFQMNQNSTQSPNNIIDSYTKQKYSLSNCRVRKRSLIRIWFGMGWWL